MTPDRKQPNRLPEGGLVDRDAPVTFRFDGKAYQGYRGDTLASALVANGVRLVGRSFKYHRPRGLLPVGPEEPNGLVVIGSGARRETNTKEIGRTTCRERVCQHVSISVVAGNYK